MRSEIKHRKILSLLRVDSRMKLNKMSRLLQMPLSTLHDRIKKVQKQYVIKNTSLIDYHKLGFLTRGIAVVRLEKDERADVVKYLCSHPNVNTVQKINNGYDLLFELVFLHLKDMEDFFDSIESRFKLKSRHVYYIIDDLKKESFMEGIESLNLLDFYD